MKTLSHSVAALSTLARTLTSQANEAHFLARIEALEMEILNAQLASARSVKDDLAELADLRSYADDDTYTAAEIAFFRSPVRFGGAE